VQDDHLLELRRIVQAAFEESSDAIQKDLTPWQELCGGFVADFLAQMCEIFAASKLDSLHGGHVIQKIPQGVEHPFVENAQITGEEEDKDNQERHDN